MPTGRLGRVFVYNGTTWVDIGETRDVSVSAEPITTDADTFGRTKELAHDIVLSVTLLQNDDTTLNSVLSESGYVDVFISNDMSTVPSGNPPTGAGVFISQAGVSPSATLSLGGEQSFVTLEIRSRSMAEDTLTKLVK